MYGNFFYRKYFGIEDIMVYLGHTYSNKIFSPNSTVSLIVRDLDIRSHKVMLIFNSYLMAG